MASSTVTFKPNSKPSESFDVLPKAFISSLKVLFEMLDEDGDGLVHVTEIEQRWASTGTGLPFGVLNGLRKVSQKDGNISFERLCAGLKISMNSDRSIGRTKEDKQLNTATVRPNNVVHPMAVRTRSAPHLVQPTARAQNAKPRSVSNSSDHSNWELAVQKARHSEDKLYSGRKPRPKTEDRLQRLSEPSKNPRVIQHPSQRPLMRARSEGENVRCHQGKPPSVGAVPPPKRGHKPDPIYIRADLPVENELVANIIGAERHSPGHIPKQKQRSPSHSPAHRTTSSHSPKPKDLKDPPKRDNLKRGNPRRHTVTDGIDYNLLKRMKQLEQERDVLLQGLEIADQARDWYQRQLAYARQRQPGLSGSSQFTQGKDGLSAREQDHLLYRMARVQAVNKQLNNLMRNPEKDFPDHMNLAINHLQPLALPANQRHTSTSSNTSTSSQYITQLKEQNRLLTKEVSQKCELITQLEKDKAALIRQLFEARGKRPANNNYTPANTTFI